MQKRSQFKHCQTVLHFLSELQIHKKVAVAAGHLWSDCPDALNAVITEGQLFCPGVSHVSPVNAIILEPDALAQAVDPGVHARHQR